MRAQALKVPSSLALATLLAVGACGGDAESAGDDESRPIAAATAPAEPAAPAAAESSAEAPAEPEGGGAAAVDAPAGPGSDAPAEPAAPAGSGTGVEAAGERRPASRPGSAPAPRRATPRPADPASESEPARNPAPAPPTVAAGTQMGLAVSGGLSTETHRVGDPFEATVVEDVLAGDGMVLVPSGARVLGHVVESRESPGSDEPAVLTLAVDALVLHGRTVPVRATVLDLEVEAGRRDSDARTAAKVGAGAAAGAVLGRILGKDTESTIKGAVAGAAAGGAVAAITKGAHAVVRDGARLLVRIDRPLVVDR